LSHDFERTVGIAEEKNIDGRPFEASALRRGSASASAKPMPTDVRIFRQKRGSIQITNDALRQVSDCFVRLNASERNPVLPFFEFSASTFLKNW